MLSRCAGGPAKDRAAILRAGWLIYVFFIAYGSLLPFDFHPRPISDALLLFRDLPLLQIGAEGRGDWVANGVLFAPLGFFSAFILGRARNRIFRLWAFPLSFAFCCVFALAIEFAQVFFPPRTVSLNDVIAEWIGSFLGAAIGAGCVKKVDRLLNAFSLRSRTIGLGLLLGYAIAYFLLSFFPYDFLVSAAELEQKRRSGNWGLFVARDGLNAGKFMWMVKSAAEILAVMPLGLLFGWRTTGRKTFLRGFALGGFLGLGIEVTQFFLYSGISQGLSVGTRAAGFGAGVLIWQARLDWEQLRSLVRRYSLVLGMLYLFCLLGVNGWFSRNWVDLEIAAVKLGQTRFLPFYYHYYTSEAIAMVSLLAVMAMYAPVGLLAWAVRSSLGAAALIAAFFAFVVEIGKLFLEKSHADPTDISIAAFSAWSVGWIASRLGQSPRPASRLAEEDDQERVATSAVPCPTDNMKAEAAEPRTATSTVWCTPSSKGWAGLAAVLALVGWCVANFPFHPVALGLLLACCGALFWIFPPLLVAVITAALPIFDLAPWSGRFFFDEFDLLILVGLAVGYARVPPAARSFGRDRLFMLFSALVALSYLASTARGMLPLQMPDASTFTNYYSSYNAVRIAKGALWAFLLFGLLRRFDTLGWDIRRVFAWGVVAGGAGVVAVIVWERLTFPGLFDFASDYRVTGPFSSLHTGGAYVEGFLTVSAPFLLLLVLKVNGLAARVAGAALFLAATYALMVTFSRNGYAAFGIAVALFFLIATGKSRAMRTPFVRWGLVVLTAGASLAVAIPIFTGQFAQERLALTGRDFGVRMSHWTDALRIRDQDVLTDLLGMGVGRFPETHYWRSTEGSRPADYRLIGEQDNKYLRLGFGSAIYIEQVIVMEPQRIYLLSVDARSHGPGARINLPICEKWLLASFRCVWTTIELGNEVGKWVHYEKKVASSDLGGGHWYGRRPIRFTLYNSNNKLAVDIDNVRLMTPEGDNLLANGDFSHGLDRWFFSTDEHLPWHIKNLVLSIFFDQGWLGALSLGLLVTLALNRTISSAWKGNLDAGAVLASLIGFLVLGLFDSLVDTPRFLFLFLLLAWFGSFPEKARARST